MLPAFLPLFCSATHHDQRSLPVRGADGWSVRRFTSAKEIREGWPATRREDDFWIGRESLAFQIEHPQGMTTEGLVLERNHGKKRILLTAQTFYFNAADQVSATAKGETSTYNIRRKLLAPLSFKVLCIGQFLTSGTFSDDGLGTLSEAEAARLLPAVAATLMSQNSSYVAVLLKDLFRADHGAVARLTDRGFFQLPCDPVMQLRIAPDWSSFDDYLASLTSKYRVRYRRARAKLEGISRRRLDAEDVTYWRARMFQLYRSTSSGADFNAANLTPEYFSWLATRKSPAHQPLLHAGSFPDAPYEKGAENLLHGYFNQAGEMVGFTSALPNGPVLHAHYLGIEDSYKHSHHLYHNMLFDLLEDAISGQFETLDYGRTALEIKSSVGAESTDFACLLMARPWLINKLIPVFTPAVYRAAEWTPRTPFKEASRF